MNQLLTALEAAAQRHGAPVIGTVQRNGHSFVGVRFGEDVAFVPGGDGHNIYQFGNGEVLTYSWRDIGTRDYMLDAMAAHVEAYLAERDAPVRDQWSAEWLDALARADAQQDERAPFVPESTQLYQWFITRFAIANPAWELMDMTPIERGIKLRIGMNSNMIVSAGLMVVITGVMSDTVLDEALTPWQIARVAVAARHTLKAGRIGKETAQDGPTVERPVRYPVTEGWQVERTEHSATASNFQFWYMARGIVISAHEAAAVAAQEARA